MVSWIAKNQNAFFLGLSALAVALPILIGIAKGQVPKELLKSWVVPMVIVTLLLAILIQSLDRIFDAKEKLYLSLLFSAVWGAAGAYIGYIQPRRVPHLPEQALKGIQTIGFMFVVFGGLWALVSIAQYANPR